jgi:hypothetical protein
MAEAFAWSWAVIVVLPERQKEKSKIPKIDVRNRRMARIFI